MSSSRIDNPGRRNFLRTAPTAAVAGLALAESIMAVAQTAGQAASPDGAKIARGAFLFFPAQAIADDVKALDAAPGNNAMVGQNEFLVALTVEKNKSPKEFEWHEGRDHILYILDGATVYDVGGTPKGAHSKTPGEWNAPGADGVTTLALKKGDMLVIPRMTLHKRTTADSVTLILISPTGKA